LWIYSHELPVLFLLAFEIYSCAISRGFYKELRTNEEEKNNGIANFTSATATAPALIQLQPASSQNQAQAPPDYKFLV
jgi:hypothetical protein